MKKHRLFLILSILLVVFHVQADDLDDFIRSQMQKRRIPGLSRKAPGPRGAGGPLAGGMLGAFV